MFPALRRVLHGAMSCLWQCPTLVGVLLGYAHPISAESNSWSCSVLQPTVSHVLFYNANGHVHVSAMCLSGQIASLTLQP
eukprot:6227767-Karenia_brevis.AAC.1